MAIKKITDTLVQGKTEAEHALIYGLFDEGYSVDDISDKLGYTATEITKSLTRTRKRIGATIPVEEILARNGILTDKIDELLVRSLSSGRVQTKELIALKEMLFKQNQLLEGRSTENTAIQFVWDTTQNSNTKNTTCKE